MKRALSPFWHHAAVANGIGFLLISVYYIFNLDFLGFLLPENSYVYILLGLGLWQVFVLYPVVAKYPKLSFPFDIGLALASLAICLYFARHGRNITAGGWMLMPPNDMVVLFSGILCVLVLEALRRVAGLALFILCTLFVVFPIFADRMPSFLLGNSFSPVETLTMHALDSQSLVGIPMTVTGTLLMGYIVFGVVLKRTGGGQFFLDIASALMGRYRGGAGKIAVVASSLFGSMSGSSVSNVITTGSVTIPAMKRTGFAPYMAGAVEACASTGGMVMPPVMGAVAFLMAQFLGISYFTVVVAAIVPSLLFYFGLLITLDSRAARMGIAGLPREELPRKRDVLRRGWPYVGTLLVLIYMLYLQLEAAAPFWAILFLLVTVIGFGKQGLTAGGIAGLFEDVSVSVSELIATLGAVGFIIGAMSFTGVGTALSGELIALAGNNAYLLLMMGAFASFVLGMGLTTSACYIFLAVVLAPGVVSQGFNEIAVHLFILYWAIASNITPPVALACFPAARIAETSYFRVGFAAVGFGFTTYIVPFAFVLNPSLILVGEPATVAIHVLFAFVGVAMAAFGIGRYAPFVGKLEWPVALLMTVAGIVITIAPNVEGELAGLAGGAMALLLGLIARRYRLTGGRHGPQAGGVRPRTTE